MEFPVANIQVDDIESSGVQVFDHRQYVVDYKSTWTGQWKTVKYLFPVTSEECAAPSIPTAVLRHFYGSRKPEDRNVFANWGPLDLYEQFIRIRRLGTPPVTTFVGYVPSRRDNILGTLAGLNVDTGHQTFTAFGLEELLRRQTIAHSWTDLDGGETRIDRVLTFNRRHESGGGLIGNRSTDPGPADRYLFSTDGKVWNYRQIIEHLLTYFAPLGMTLQLAGQPEALELVRAEAPNLEGKSLYDALNLLINGTMGMIWHIPTVERGTVFISVRTINEKAVKIGANVLPANSQQARIDAAEGHEIEEFVTVKAGQVTYDRILLRGEPVEVCCSLSYADGTLEKGWTSAEQTAYDAVADANDLPGDKWINVYQKHRLKRPWDGYVKNGQGGGPPVNALPAVNLNGTINTDTQSKFFNFDKKFLRLLPFLMGKDYLNDTVTDNNPSDAEPEFREPFAVVKHPENNKWYYVEQFDGTDYPEANAEVRMAAREMAAFVRGKKPHVYAKDVYGGGIDDPEASVDYRQLILTVAFELDERLEYEIVLNPNGNKTKYIDVPGARLQYVVPGTTTDVTDGILRNYKGGAVRDDSSTLAAIAPFARVWYGTPRRAVEATWKDLKLIAPVGTLIKSADVGRRVQEVGTVVTRRRFDYIKNRTTITTEFLEMDVLAISNTLLRGVQVSPDSLDRQVAVLTADVRDLRATPPPPSRRPMGGGGGEFAIEHWTEP